MRHSSILVVAASLGPLVLACSSSSSAGNGTTQTGGDGGVTSDSGTPVDNDASSADTGSTGTGDGGASQETSAPTARVRVAHLSPDAPAVDFCLAAHATTTFSGPVLEAAGNTAGLAYSTITEYLSVPAGQYDVRLVAPGATDCSTSLAGLPDTTSLPTLAAGGSFTVAATGDVTKAGNDPSFTLQAFVDEATVAAGMASVRFIHASPGTPAVDVGLVSGSTFTPVFKDVSFGQVAAAGGGIDANGYLVTTPLSGVTLGAAATGTTTVVKSVAGVSVPAGAIVTAIAIGGKTMATTNPLQVLLCIDSAAPSSGLTSCTAM